MCTVSDRSFAGILQGRRLSVRPQSAGCAHNAAGGAQADADPPPSNGIATAPESKKEGDAVSLLDANPLEWFGGVAQEPAAQQPTKLGKVQIMYSPFNRPRLG